MSVRNTFNQVVQENTRYRSPYALANDFANTLAEAGYSQVSIVNFIVEFCDVDDDSAIEISCRVAP